MKTESNNENPGKHNLLVALIRDGAVSGTMTFAEALELVREHVEDCQELKK